MAKYRYLLVVSLLLLLVNQPFLLPAASLKEAMDEAATYFTKTAVKIEPGQELYVKEVVNFHSLKHDQEGKRIETELFFALERLFSDFKLFLGAGMGGENEMYLSGSYEIKADETVVKLVITKNNEVLAQKEVTFDNQKARRKTLIAVLDIEAEALNEVQKKAFSDIFRSELSQYDIFDIASSADVDKMDPDQIQQATGCSRDSCATLIGEQLGVDRVISSSMFKVSDDLYVLSAKMMDILEGSILVSKTINHSGTIRDLPASLKELAFQMTGEKEKIKSAEARIEKEEEIAKPESNGPSLLWHISAIGLTAYAAISSSQAVSNYNDLASQNDQLKAEYEETVLVSERQSIQNEFDDNKSQMEEQNSSISLYNNLMVVGLLWEAYLIYATVTAEDTTAQITSWFIPDSVVYQPMLSLGDTGAGLYFSWHW